MSIDFRKRLSEDARKRHDAADGYYAERRREVEAMTNGNLKATAKYYMSQMQEPWKHEFSCPTYDAAFWHVIIPELLKRLKEEVSNESI